MNHEFRLHHYISELMKELGVHQVPDGPGAEAYTELLQKSMTPYITTQVTTHNAKRKLAEHSQQPREFLSKYDELKAKNVHDLDPLVFLLSKLCDDSQVTGLLKKNAEQHLPVITSSVSLSSSATGHSTASHMTAEELEKIRAELMKVASQHIMTKESDVSRKILRDKTSKRSVVIPVQPDWLFSRPSLTMDFLTDNSSSTPQDPNDADTAPSLPVRLQEAAIIDDLLNCAEGVEGKYIKVLPLTDKHAARQFHISPSVEPSLRELAGRILPICSHYSVIVRFIEEKSRFECGLVNQALSAAYRTLVKDYLVLIAQLEHQQHLGQLTLQKLWFYIQPTMRTMEIMASVATSINRGDCAGGSVLSLLHEKTSSLIGDTKGQELCLYLTQSACVPYFELLEKWIYKGIIQDPYAEFLVEQNDEFQKEKLQEDYNDSYWEQHYTICHDSVPLFLESVASKILNTGKYLNVVRQCGRDVKCPDAREVIYTIKERQYFEHIETAYSYASQLLLDLLMNEKNLMARLRSVKHYFLLDQCDFIVQFMDMAEDEMKKSMEDIMLTRLESLLELALRTSTSNIDPYKDDLRVDLLPYDLTTQLFKILTIETKQEKEYKIDPTDLRLSGLEAFTLDYVVKWPVSLVISRKALTKYQMLFRHLFYCKHVERQLCYVWLCNKSAKLFTLNSTRWYAAAFALRQRMLNFVQNLQYYMMFEVIEPNWQQFESKMDTVSNLDDVLMYHADFLSSCLKDCMLTSPDLLKIVHKLLMVCVMFSNFIQRLSTDVDISDDQATASQSVKERDETRRTSSRVLLSEIDTVAGSDNFERTISTFDRNFSTNLIDLLDRVMDFSVANCEHKLMNILYRLDFNNFYTKQLETFSAEKTSKDSSEMST